MTHGIQLNVSQSMATSQNKNDSGYKVGKQLEALVIEKNSEITKVMFNERLIEMSSDIQVVEDVGESLLLEVTKVKNDHIELKYVPPERSMITNRSFLSEPNHKKSVEVLNNFSQDLLKKIQPIDIDEEKAITKMVNQVKSDLTDLVTKMTNEDVKSMMAEDLNINKLTIRIITQVIDHQKKSVAAHDIDAIEKAVATEVAKYKSVYKDEEQLASIVKNLKLVNLPVTKKNIDKINEVLNQLKVVEEQSSKKAMTLLKGEEPMTIKEAYKAIHTPQPNVGNVDMEPTAMKAMVEKHLEAIGIPITSKAVEIATEFVVRGMEISKEKIEFVLDPLTTFSKLDYEKVTHEMTVKLMNKEKIDSIIIDPLTQVRSGLITTSQTEIKLPGEVLSPMDLLTKIQNIENHHIITMVQDESEPTLEALFKLQTLEVEKGLVEKEDTDLKKMDPSQLEAEKKVVHEKRFIEEIRLKMTLEAAVKLEGKGFKITTEPLEKVVENLRAYEQSLYTQTSQTYQVTLNADQVNEVASTLSAVKQVKELPEQVIMQMLRGELPQQLEQLKVATDALQEKNIISEMAQQIKFKTASSQYETTGTQIRPDLGDKVEKAFKHIDPILEELGLPVTEANHKAVEILARNAMPLTEDNILEIQIIQQKVDQITKHMNPYLVIEMVEGNQSPLELDFDQILETMEAFNRTKGELEGDKISRLIWELDQSKTISMDMRDSLLGIYRTLDTIQRAKGAATGFLVKNNLPLTIENLFDAAKYIQKSRGSNPVVEAGIDNDFGLVESVNRKEISIKEQVQKALSEMGASHNSKNVATIEALKENQVEVTKTNFLAKTLLDFELKAFMEELTTPKMTELLKEPQLDAKNTLLSDLKSMMSSNTQKEVQTQPDLEELLEFVKGHENLVKTLVKNQVPVTPENLSKAIELNKEPFALVDQLRSFIKGIEAPELKENVVNRILQMTRGVLKGQKTSEDMKQMLETLKDEVHLQEENLSPSAVKSMSSAIGTSNHVQMIQLTENYYQIPIMMGQELSQLNLYLLNNQEEGIKEDLDGVRIFMSFRTANLGNVQAMIEINGNQMSMNMQSELLEDRGLLKSFEGEIRQLVSTTNFNLEGIGYEPFRVREPIMDELKDMDRPSNTPRKGSTFEIQI